MTDADPPSSATVVPIDPTDLLSETFDRGQVTDLRHRVASCALSAGMHGQRLDDFVLAVNELITNAVRHGGGRGWLRMWREAHSMVCEVSDNGHGIETDRLHNRDRPAPNTAGGWGLWLTERLTDTMAVATSSSGTTVRISLSVPATGSAGREPAGQAPPGS
ncbi:ATP-binding protein [Solwaraspora sp. WMMD406]|uniref:ATP-binding protein n=1 Tax=Solwaraspora sp. WMMD406 TaxID=3016095 RepID=UPI002417F7FD|nr:ATP-binding protein [Solwaraspora sp. WMMD406]MDG4767652.1 ATP-binding protein [Solwaraspora sp. WMMD406]